MTVIKKPEKAQFLRDLCHCPDRAVLHPLQNNTARCREIQRSELVTVPSFSLQPSAGNSTSATVQSVSAITLRHDHQGTVGQRLLDLIGIRHRHNRIGRHGPDRFNFTEPPQHRTDLTAFKPCSVAMVGECQNWLYQYDGVGFSISICAASILDRPPTTATHRIRLTRQ